MTAPRRLTAEPLTRAATPTSSARPPATGSGWPTPTCYRDHEDRSGGPAERRRGRLRRRQGDPRVDGPVPAPPAPRARPDTVITGAVILDHWGIVKADVGIRDGRIVALGKAGNPDTHGRRPTPTWSSARRPRSSRATARSSPPAASTPTSTSSAPADRTRRWPPASPRSIGGGTGPAEGSKATTVTPGAWHLARMFEAMDACPVNVGLLGKGNTMSTESPARPGAGRRPRLQDPRGLGRHPRRHRRLPDGLPTRAASSSPSTPTRSTRPASSATPSPPSAAARSTPSTSRAPAAAMPPT